MLARQLEILRMRDRVNAKIRAALEGLDPPLANDRRAVLRLQQRFVREELAAQETSETDGILGSLRKIFGSPQREPSDLARQRRAILQLQLDAIEAELSADDPSVVL